MVEIPTLKKALLINQNPNLYGTFAEIGAGQEVARHFFQAGLASQTVAKSISAYDMTFSDEIYGKSQRYVSYERLIKMLDHEYGLLEERLCEQKNKSFFAFADTVATNSDINHCHGWMGVRFQLGHDRPANDIILHVKMIDPSRLQQQEALGVLGVNLIFTALHLSATNQSLVESLNASLGHRVEVDFIKLNGPDLKNYDERALAIELVKKGLTKAVLFGDDGQPQMISDSLYSQPALAMRGTFRPITQANLDIVTNSLKQIQTQQNLKNPPKVLLEISMKHPQNRDCPIADYLDRIDSMASLKHSIIISNFDFSYELTTYLRQSTNEPIALIVGAANLDHLFNSDIYSHLRGGILNAFGRLFDENTFVYVYPFKNQQICLTTKSYFPNPENKGLYEYLIQNNKIVDVLGCDDVDTSILAGDVRKMLQNHETEWEQHVPKTVADTIKQNKLFGFGK